MAKSSRRSTDRSGGSSRPAPRRPLERLYAELDSVDEPHPAIEPDRWCRERIPLERPPSSATATSVSATWWSTHGLVAVQPTGVHACRRPGGDLAWPL
jgi:hypothetical protein